MPHHEDEAWTQMIASLVVGDLIRAGLIEKADFERARNVASEEILAQLLFNRPAPTNGSDQEVDRVTAAAKVIHEAGRHHRWWRGDKRYEDLDPIGRSEFDGIVQQALRAAELAAWRRKPK
jgi:hypothetical protein